MFRPEQCRPEVDEAVKWAAEAFNFPRAWLYAVIQRESGFDPRAVNDWDHAAGTRHAGAGLTQLTGETHCGAPYPHDLREPDNSFQQWRDNMGLDGRYLGAWVDMKDVSRMEYEERFDAKQNLVRFCTVYAVPFFHLMKKKHPRATNWDLLRRVAFHWNKGLPYRSDTFDSDDESYLGGDWGFDHFFGEFNNSCTADGDAVAAWDGNPRLGAPPEGGRGDMPPADIITPPAEPAPPETHPQFPFPTDPAVKAWTINVGPVTVRVFSPSAFPFTIHEG